MQLVLQYAREQRRVPGAQLALGIWIQVAVQDAHRDKRRAASIAQVTGCRLFARSSISVLLANPGCGNHQVVTGGEGPISWLPGPELAADLVTH
jgi:hypothetical protein